MTHPTRRDEGTEPDSGRKDSFSAGTDQLIIDLYDELRTIAHREHFRAGMPQTLQTTALIGEAYVRLQRRQGWAGRTHFLGCAATAMRHVLIDAARARLSAKRAGQQVEATDDLPAPAEDTDLIKLGDALTALSSFDPDLARLVDCRFFAGYDEQETAEVLGISDRTVRRRWTRARAWIHAELAQA